MQPFSGEQRGPTSLEGTPLLGSRPLRLWVSHRTQKGRPVLCPSASLHSGGGTGPGFPSKGPLQLQWLPPHPLLGQHRRVLGNQQTPLSSALEAALETNDWFTLGKRASVWKGWLLGATCPVGGGGGLAVREKAQAQTGTGEAVGHGERQQVTSRASVPWTMGFPFSCFCYRSSSSPAPGSHLHNFRGKTSPQNLCCRSPGTSEDGRSFGETRPSLALWGSLSSGREKMTCTRLPFPRDGTLRTTPICGAR